MNPNNIFDKYAPRRVSTGTVLYTIFRYIVINVLSVLGGVMIGLTEEPMVKAIVTVVAFVNALIMVLVIVTIFAEYGDDVDRWVQQKCNGIEQWIESRYGCDDR